MARFIHELKRAHARAAIALTIATVGCLTGAGCSDDVRSHVFSGRQLEEARSCLDPVSSIDVVDGPQPGACDPKCIVSSRDPDSGASTVYVSTMCPPLPAAPYDTTEGDARCPAALALYAANVTCLADGGVGNLAPVDAGAGGTGDAGGADGGGANGSGDAGDAGSD